jgi:hypothetical protein
MGGSRGSAREEREGDEIGRCKPKRKTYFREGAMARGPDGPAGWRDGLWGRGRLARWTGPVGPTPRKKSNEN